MKFVTSSPTRFASGNRTKRCFAKEPVGGGSGQTKFFQYFDRYPKRIEELGFRQGNEAPGLTGTLAVNETSQGSSPQVFHSSITGRSVRKNRFGLSVRPVLHNCSSDVINSADVNPYAFEHATRGRSIDGSAAANGRQTEKKQKHEKGNVDQRITAGRMPDRCGRKRPAGGTLH